ncbi:MAG: TonB-dependent receptor plug domain-containing protein [Bacteroidales bacterium]|nr:TonB-dependent receptor plug domain-containing protein [Bacteroidales bacterium]
MKIKGFFLIILSLMLMNTSSGQKNYKKIVISGIVTDAQSRPVKGALIMVDNKNTDKITDDNGFYKIRIRPDADTITIITFNNGVSNAPVNGRATINFTLSGSASSQPSFQNNPRDNEVTNIGYGSFNKKDITGPVSKVEGQRDANSKYRDIYDMLRGTPGVSVNGKSIQIQGPTSINLSSEPLFVVDGMAVQSIDDIVPSMVESITVLKGSSASIYGSRGAAGVILITMKGSSGKK